MNQLPLGAFAPELNPELSQYHSPVKLCRRIVKMAGINPGDRVLEPSAGGGNLVRELLRAGGNITAVEIDNRWASALWTEFPTLKVWVADFLKLDVMQVDLVVMNPPLDKGVGPSHVARALLWAPRVISILRSQDLHGVERYEELWSKCDVARQVHCVRRPVYTGSGGMIETVVVDVRRRGTYHGPQTIEFWPDSWKE